MLSAHQPFERFPEVIRKATREVGATAQVAGGVPAMCDGVTQGVQAWRLSLFSRDVIAMSVGVALTHDAFDAGARASASASKIVPGLFMGALAFGHLPVVFAPPVPMPTRHPERREGPRPGRVCPGQGRPPDPAGVARSASLPLARHLHLLRHRQLRRR